MVHSDTLSVPPIVTPIRQLILQNKCQEAFHVLSVNPAEVPLQHLYMLILHAGDHDVEHPFDLTQLLLSMDFNGHQTLVSFRNAKGWSPVAYLVLTDMMDPSNNQVVKMALAQYPHAVQLRDKEGMSLIEAVFWEWELLTALHPGPIDNSDDGANEGTNEGADEGTSGELHDELQASMKPHVKSKSDLPCRLQALWERIEMVLQASTCAILHQNGTGHMNTLMDACMCKCPVPPSLFGLAVQLSGPDDAKEANSFGQVPLVALLVSASQWDEEKQTSLSDEEMHDVDGAEGDDADFNSDDNDDADDDHMDETHGEHRSAVPITNKKEDILISNMNMLLRSFPGIARIPHETDARLPFHVALATGHGWNVLHPLFLAFPAAITAEDPITRLHPCLLPITSPYESIETLQRVNTAFMTLCEAPAFLDQHVLLCSCLLSRRQD